MQFGVVVPSYGTFADAAAIREIVVASEALDFDTAWFGDHIVIPRYAVHLSPPRWFDALACCFVGAGLTTRLRFGTDVLVLPYRNPVMLSQLVATADQLCDGRLTLGVGIGYIRGEFDALATPPYEERGAITDEYLDVLRTLWEAEGGVSHAGRYVQFRDVHAGPEPAQRPFPLWVGGNGAAGRRRAAQRGNGWHPLFPTPEAYRAGRADIVSQRSSSDHPFTFSLSCPETRVILDGSERRASISYSDLPDIPDEYGYAPSFPLAPDGRQRFVGNPDELIDDINAYFGAGVDHFALRFWIGDPGTKVDAFIDQLVRFRRYVAAAFPRT